MSKLIIYNEDFPILENSYATLFFEYDDYTNGKFENKKETIKISITLQKVYIYKVGLFGGVAHSLFKHDTEEFISLLSLHPQFSGIDFLRVLPEITTLAKTFKDPADFVGNLYFFLSASRRLLKNRDKKRHE